MRALLTSAGIKNSSIHDAPVDLLGEPIAEPDALFIPTAIYPFPGGADGTAEHRRGCLGANGPAPGAGLVDFGVVDGAARVVSEGQWRLFQP